MPALESGEARTTPALTLRIPQHGWFRRPTGRSLGHLVLRATSGVYSLKHLAMRSGWVSTHPYSEPPHSMGPRQAKICSSSLPNDDAFEFFYSAYAREKLTCASPPPLSRPSLDIMTPRRLRVQLTWDRPWDGR